MDKLEIIKQIREIELKHKELTDLFDNEESDKIKLLFLNRMVALVKERKKLKHRLFGGRKKRKEYAIL